MRTGNRRLTRLTSAFSKSLYHHAPMLALYLLRYDFCRLHKSLPVTPAMADGLDTTVRDCEWVVGLIDARAPKPNRPALRYPRLRRVATRSPRAGGFPGAGSTVTVRAEPEEAASNGRWRASAVGRLPGEPRCRAPAGIPSPGVVVSRRHGAGWKHSGFEAEQAENASEACYARAMSDHSDLIAQFLIGPPDEVPRFFIWVAQQEPGDDPRGDFIKDTRAVLQAGGDPASAVQARGLPHTVEPFGELLAEWRAAGSK